MQHQSTLNHACRLSGSHRAAPHSAGGGRRGGQVCARHPSGSHLQRHRRRSGGCGTAGCGSAAHPAANPTRHWDCSAVLMPVPVSVSELGPGGGEEVKACIQLLVEKTLNNRIYKIPPPPCLPPVPVNGTKLKGSSSHLAAGVGSGQAVDGVRRRRRLCQGRQLPQPGYRLCLIVLCTRPSPHHHMRHEFPTFHQQWLTHYGAGNTLMSHQQGA